jgi:hypothetical protein
MPARTSDHGLMVAIEDQRRSTDDLLPVIAELCPADAVIDSATRSGCAG